VLSIRANDGSYDDHNFAANYSWARSRLDQGRLKVLFVYCYWRLGAAIPNLMSQVNANGGPHPRMAAMIDLESGGNANIDESVALAGDYNTLVSWLGGNDARVIGYGNQGDLRTMWQFPGHQIDVIIAGYGANPSSPNSNLVKIAHQYTDGAVAADGLPMGAPPFGNCDMNSADGLSVDALAAAVGVGVGSVTPVPPVVTPPGPPVTPAPPSVTLPTDDSIYAAIPEIWAQFQA
jgi:hypothetical protein